jgi:1-acyl-sn-glycerol-3-phosphate acyltransferase
MTTDYYLEKHKKTYQRGSIAYRIFKSYVRFFHNRIYYRHIYNVQTENIPASGTPLMIVSNHQNCLNDALGILFSMHDRKPYFIMRADVFDYHPILNKFFRGLGLLPAFRIDFEGIDALSKNKDTFLLSEQMLLDGNTLVMFPEAGHQEKRWLNNFTFGFTKMAFEAAALGNFETDILILPSCNHYSDYFQLQEQILIKYGTPISIKPFYELYKTRPRTAQRQLSTLVRKQIESLMLDIRDLDNYEVIHFLRNTYGKRFAKQHQYDEEKLPDRLLSDRLLVAGLEKIKANGKEDELGKHYAEALTLQKGIADMKINDALFDRCPSWMAITGRILALILLFPLWLFSLWPNALHYVLPTILINRMTDKMFYGSFLLIFSIMITIPLFYTLTFVLTWIYANVWLALACLAALPLLGLFAWYYRKFFKQTIQALRFRINFKTKKMNNLRVLRKGLFEGLDKLFMGETGESGKENQLIS